MRRPVRVLCAPALACAFALACPATGLAGTHAFRAEADGYVRSDRPGTSFGASRRLSVLRRGARVRRAFLRFDVKVPAGEAVTGAALKLYALSRGSRRGIVVRAVPDDAWSQSTVTWRRTPRVGKPVARARRYPRHRWLRLDLGRQVRGPGLISVAIFSRSRSSQRFASSEDRRRAPRLVVRTAPAGVGQSPPRPGHTPPSTPLRSPSGEPMPLADLTGWRLVFADDFDVPVPLGRFPAAVASKWSAYPSSARDTSGNGQYFPEKVISVRDGVLNMFIHSEGGKRLVSAPVPKVTGAGSFGQLYGRYAVRFRADALPRYKTAWLLWPDSGRWPGDGEIDFPEGDLDDTIKGYVHRQGGSSGSDQVRFATTARYPDWHTAIIEWTPGKVVFILDGQVIGQTTSRVPSTAMHWVLQTETALKGGAPSPSTQGNVQVDWVAVWARR